MRLIDAEAFLDFLRIEEHIMDGEEITFDYIRSLIVSAPTIKAKPIVTRNCDYCHNGAYRKSFCQPDGTFVRYANYCEECGRDLTNCGAQMDEGVKIPVISMEDVPKLMEDILKGE